MEIEHLLSPYGMGIQGFLIIYQEFQNFELKENKMVINAYNC